MSYIFHIMSINNESRLFLKNIYDSDSSFAHLFLYCFHPLSHKQNVQTSSLKSTDIFSIAIHLFRNLF